MIEDPEVQAFDRGIVDAGLFAGFQKSGQGNAEQAVGGSLRPELQRFAALGRGRNEIQVFDIRFGGQGGTDCQSANRFTSGVAQQNFAADIDTGGQRLAAPFLRHLAAEVEPCAFPGFAPLFVGLDPAEFPLRAFCNRYRFFRYPAFGFEFAGIVEIILFQAAAEQFRSFKQVIKFKLLHIISPYD